MTKQNFIALADFIRISGAFTKTQVESLADFCKSQNGAFMRDRWIGYIEGTNGKNGGAVKKP